MSGKDIKTDNSNSCLYKYFFRVKPIKPITPVQHQLQGSYCYRQANKTRPIQLTELIVRCIPHIKPGP